METNFSPFDCLKFDSFKPFETFLRPVILLSMGFATLLLTLTTNSEWSRREEEEINRPLRENESTERKIFHF